jgi:hypothetical protein
MTHTFPSDAPEGFDANPNSQQQQQLLKQADTSRIFSRKVAANRCEYHQYIERNPNL